METCQGKSIYDKKSAETKLNYLIESGIWSKKNKGRVYYCGLCNNYHITSKKNEPKVDMRGVGIKFKNKWKEILKNQNK